MSGCYATDYVVVNFSFVFLFVVHIRRLSSIGLEDRRTIIGYLIFISFFVDFFDPPHR